MQHQKLKIMRKVELFLQHQPTNKQPASCVQQLIDNKRKLSEKALFAAQRDKMLLEEAKEDARFRKDMTESMNQSTITLAQGIKDVSKAILEMGAGLCRSIEMVSQGFNHGYPQHHPANQNNMFYQYASQHIPPHTWNLCWKVYIGCCIHIF